MKKHSSQDTPEALDAIADVVLAYKPKPKSETFIKKSKKVMPLIKISKLPPERKDDYPK